MGSSSIGPKTALIGGRRGSAAISDAAGRRGSAAANSVAATAAKSVFTDDSACDDEGHQATVRAQQRMDPAAGAIAGLLKKVTASLAKPEGRRSNNFDLTLQSTPTNGEPVLTVFIARRNSAITSGSDCGGDGPTDNGGGTADAAAPLHSMAHCVVSHVPAPPAATTAPLSVPASACTLDLALTMAASGSPAISNSGHSARSSGRGGSISRTGREKVSPGSAKGAYYSTVGAAALSVSAEKAGGVTVPPPISLSPVAAAPPDVIVFLRPARKSLHGHSASSTGNGTGSGRCSSGGSGSAPPQPPPVAVVAAEESADDGASTRTDGGSRRIMDGAIICCADTTTGGDKRCGADGGKQPTTALPFGTARMESSVQVVSRPATTSTQYLRMANGSIERGQVRAAPSGDGERQYQLLPTPLYAPPSVAPHRHNFGDAWLPNDGSNASGALPSSGSFRGMVHRQFHEELVVKTVNTRRRRSVFPEDAAVASAVSPTVSAAAAAAAAATTDATTVLPGQQLTPRAAFVDVPLIAVPALGVPRSAPLTFAAATAPDGALLARAFGAHKRLTQPQVVSLGVVNIPSTCASLRKPH